MGIYGDVTGVHGFLDSGSFTPINVPGATFTYARGINTDSQIVGYYGTTPLATVSESSSLLLLGAGLLGLAAWRWKHAA